MSEQKRRGRKPGSKNKFPSHTKMRDEFQRHNFDFIEEWVKLYKSSEDEIRAKLITSTQEFLFARRKPEDSAGDAGEVNPTVSPELLAQVVAIMGGK